MGLTVALKRFFINTLQEPRNHNKTDETRPISIYTRKVIGSSPIPPTPTFARAIKISLSSKRVRQKKRQILYVPVQARHVTATTRRCDPRSSRKGFRC